MSGAYQSNLGLEDYFVEVLSVGVLVLWRDWGVGVVGSRVQSCICILIFAQYGYYLCTTFIP